MLLRKFPVSLHDQLTNLDYASASHTGFDSLATDQTITGQKIFTKVPGGTGFANAVVSLNPATAPANADLLWLGWGDTEKFTVDEDGDIQAGGTLRLVGGPIRIESSGNYARLNAYGKTGGWVIYGPNPGNSRLTVGPGATGQLTLGANLDQNDVFAKRDVDGDGGSYSEAGYSHVWQRDVTNVSAENGGFWAAMNAADTVLADLDKAGNGTFGNLTVAGQGYVHIRGDDDSDDDPGCLVLYNHAGTPYYLWVDQTGDFRIHTSAPADEDADGTIVGTQN